MSSIELKKIPGLEIRLTTLEDGAYLKEWLGDPAVVRWFPMSDTVEVDDATMRWISFARYHCSVTAVVDGKPAGLATLYLQPYRNLAHQCEFGIIVSPEMRDKGVGSHLLNSLMYLAKERFKIEVLHLQVYADNPAIRLYRRFGFVEFGRQTHWVKSMQPEGNVEYIGRVFMERFL
ncbi:MAG: GNAT family N-acetyltransferase [Parachlamydiales bacterium]|jgi:putative acetyltransferase